MNKTTLLKNLFALIFVLGTTFSIQAQNKKHTKPVQTVFGKKINPENINPENGLVRCATVEYEQHLQEQNPKRFTDAQFEAWLAPLLENYKNNQSTFSQSGGIITIPVVVHVIHSGQNIGSAPNITDSQVASQITVMNNDFRRLAGTPGFNTNAVGADVMIQFALAKSDPNGNPTNGINRVNLCQTSWSTDEIDTTVKPQTIWNPALYLNMWSVLFTNGTLLGYAQFPDASGLPGLNTSGGNANSDGVVCNYATFGSINYNDGTFLLAPPYNEGRTMTHEVGHWLGLRHIWGDANNCTVDDFCADTPMAGAANFGCLIGTDSCPNSTGLDMIQNYMDYTDDACMNIFTQNQKDRITVIMNNAARRSTLKTSTKDVAIPLFVNDAEIKLEGNCTNPEGSCSIIPTRKVTLYNRGTSNLTSASINYTIAGTTSTYNWTGNLAQNKFSTFDMPINATASGFITLNIVNANGVADQRASNNSATGTFTLPTAAPNFAYTTFVFTLQRDRYASETAWNIKNSAGTVVYTSPAYTDGAVQPLITETWTLPANDCYTFTITDSYGDGICCEFGQGYYNIKSQSGVDVFTSDGAFGSGQAKTFTNNSLSTGEFANASGIYVHPNPSKNNLNIVFPAQLGLPDSYEIINYLGQKVSQKKITSENDFAINTSALSSGVYLITISKDNQKKTMRFIKE